VVQVETTSPYPLPNHHVVQPDLSPYITPLPLTYSVPGTDTPLLTFRLTQVRPLNASVLGISACHGIVDGCTANRMLHHLSELYQDPRATHLDMIPTFGPSVMSPPAPISTPEAGFYDPCTLTEMFGRIAESATESEPTTIVLTRAEVQNLRRSLGLDVSVSDQDALTGWWVSVLDRLGERVDLLWYAVNVSAKIVESQLHLTCPVPRPIPRPPSLPFLGLYQFLL
jgi:hypothetical protein